MQNVLKMVTHGGNLFAVKFTVHAQVILISLIAIICFR